MSRPDSSEGRYDFGQWVEEYLVGTLALTYTRIDSPEAIFEMVRAEPLPERLRGVAALAEGDTLERVLVGVMPAPCTQGGSLVVEGHMNTCYLKAAELSMPDGMALAIHGTPDSGVLLRWTKAGVLQAEYSLSDGDDIDGDDTQRFVEILRQTGLDPDDTSHPWTAAAVLMREITAVAVTPTILTETPFTVGSVPREYW